MEWKEIKDGKPVEEGAEDKSELKAEVKAQEPAEQKPEAPAEAPAEKAPEAKTEAPAEKEPEKKVEAPAENPEAKAETPSEDSKSEASAKDNKSEASVEDKTVEDKSEDKPAEKEEKTPGEKAAEKKAGRARRFTIYSKAFFYVLVLGAAVVILFFFIGVGIKNTDGPVGYWTIKEASSGDVVMKPEDAEAMGLREIGAFKLNRGGDCEITYLGKKAQGTWKQSDSGKIVIKYGEDKKIVAQISTKTGVMKAKDNESMVYKLEK